MPQNWEEQYQKLFNDYIGSCFECCDAEDLMSKQIAIIKQTRQQDMEELIKRIEALIQKERFAGAPYALSKVQELIKDYYKQ